jgi:hypothetical protein
MASRQRRHHDPHHQHILAPAATLVDQSRRVVVIDHSTRVEGLLHSEQHGGHDGQADKEQQPF